jgi:hypothetical protein
MAHETEMLRKSLFTAVISDRLDARATASSSGWWTT